MYVANVAMSKDVVINKTHEATTTKSTPLYRFTLTLKSPGNLYMLKMQFFHKKKKLYGKTRVKHTFLCTMLCF